jgi:hypothetical protein
MKKTLAILVLSLGGFVQANAQFVVVDPGHIVATIANGGIMSGIQNTTQQINQVSNSINGIVGSINNLQHSVDNALKTVRGVVRGTAFSNIQGELSLHNGLIMELSPYLSAINPGEYSFLQQGYGNNNATLGGSILHQVLDIPLDTQLPTQSQAALAFLTEKRQNKQLFNAMAGQKAIQIALSYNQLADVMIEKAKELNALLKNDKNANGEANSLKMNEAERLKLFATTSDYVRKSLELKLACDEIIRKEISQGQESEKAMGTYRLYNSLTNFYSK